MEGYWIFATTASVVAGTRMATGARSAIPAMMPGWGGGRRCCEARRVAVAAVVRRFCAREPLLTPVLDIYLILRIRCFKHKATHNEYLALLSLQLRWS